MTLGDQPRVSAAAIEQVVAAWNGESDAVRATFGGAPGHPVLLARRLFGAIASLRGDAGARKLLTSADVVEVACDHDVVLDVDTPARLRMAEAKSPRHA